MSNVVPELAPDNRYVVRVALVDGVRAALREGRSVVLVGAPGSGKTRLAAECLRRLTEETAVVVRLVDVRDREGLVARVAAAAGVWLSPAVSTADAEARIERSLAARGPTIFVLDNFEQLPNDVDDLVRRWMHASTMGWLVTSRRRIACDAEHVEVTPLAVAAPPGGGWSEAATLMRFRAEEIARVRFEPSDHDTIEEVVRRLDGLPLAIELAAARLAILTPSQLLARLDKRFSTLDGGGKGLAAALEASFSLLDDAARDCLRACSVFRGGIRLEALERVLDHHKDVLASLATLRNQSLLTVERVGDVYRYGLDQSVRELVESLESASPAWEAARASHAAYWADAAEAELEAPALGREIENLRAAFGWACDRSLPLAARLGLALSSPALGLPYQAAREIVSAVMDRPDYAELPAPLRGALAFRRGTVRRYLADFDAAVADLEEAGRIAHAIGDRALAGEVLAGLGNARSAQADWDGARSHLERAIATHPAPGFRSLALAMIANTFSNEDAFDRAEPLLRRAITEADAAHDVFTGAFARLSLGILLVERGDFDDAFTNLLDSLTVLETSRSARVMQARHLRAIALTHLARVKQETGDTAGALTDYHEAVGIAEETGVRRAEAFALYGVASLLLELRELDAADDRIRAALPLMRENAKDVEGALVALQGVLFALRGAHEDAERFFRRARVLLEAHKRPVFEVALAVLRGEEAPPGPYAGFADVLLARRLRALFSEKKAGAPLFVAEDGSFFRSPETGEPVSLVRRKAVRGVLKALVEARVARPGVPVTIDALVTAGWPGEKVLPAAGAERVFAAIATLRRLGLRGVIAQKADGYLLPADRAVLPHAPSG